MLLKTVRIIVFATLLFASTQGANGQTNDSSERFPDTQFPATYTTEAKKLQQDIRISEQEAIRAEQEWNRRREALIAQGGCNDTVEQKPALCTQDYTKTPATLEAIYVPRFAAPFQVQLVKSDKWLTADWLREEGRGRAKWENQHHCGASLVAEDWIVTAAHCLPKNPKPELFGVRLDVDNISQSETQPIAVKQIIPHPEYSGKPRFLNDIALLQIATGYEVLINKDTLEYSIPNRKIRSMNYLEETHQAVAKLSDGLHHLIDVDTGKVIPYTPETPQNTSGFTSNRHEIQRRAILTPTNGYGMTISDKADNGKYVVLSHEETVDGVQVPSKTISIWNTEDKVIDQRIKLDMKPLKAVFTHRDRRLVVWSVLGDVEVWDIKRNRRLSRFSPGFDSVFAVLKVYDKGRRFFIGNKEGRSQSWNLERGDLHYEVDHSLPVHEIKVTPDEKYFVTRSDFGTTEVRNLKSGKAKARVFHGDQITGAKLIDKQKVLMTWGDEGFVKFWSLANGKEIGRVLATKLSNGFADNSKFPSLVEIVTVSKSESDIKQAETVIVTGWGKTRPVRGAEPAAVLGLIGLEPISREACLIKTGWHPDVIQDDKAFCASDKQRKTCYGDSGGPVIADKKLVGIVSWGSGKCEADKKPSVYTKVPTYYPWIKQTICNNVSSAYPNPKICKGL